MRITGAGAIGRGAPRAGRSGSIPIAAGVPDLDEFGDIVAHSRMIARQPETT
jgi:hypothetical protein